MTHDKNNYLERYQIKNYKKNHFIIIYFIYILGLK